MLYIISIINKQNSQQRPSSGTLTLPGEANLLQFHPRLGTVPYMNLTANQGCSLFFLERLCRLQTRSLKTYTDYFFLHSRLSIYRAQQQDCLFSSFGLMGMWGMTQLHSTINLCPCHTMRRVLLSSSSRIALFDLCDVSNEISIF